ncbi:nuclease domain-containing protein [Massilia phyllosphaerae]|uniref:nuclease domain-containing protein n=1 Tax=Massilia phyllosphaerae TaxID=3106034 RepID=UPI002B1CC5F6|nr:nuclease domain-containing protein [Massilia sp. SGZ-792]
MMRRSPLKNGKPLQRKKAMSRGSGFSRAGTKTPAAGASLLRVAAVQAKARDREAKPAKPRKPMKSSRPKMTPIRASARGQDCTLRFPGICNRNPETTAWCHSNRLEDGKGMGLKAPDHHGCYGCSDCHAWLDGGYAGRVAREVVDARFDAARAESQEKLRALGLMPEQDNEKEAA